MKLVLKLGGHNLTRKLSYEALIPYLNTIKTLLKEGHRIVIVTGGGTVARQYIRVAREFAAEESFSDELGIEVARLNAKLLIAGLGEMAFPQVPTTLETLEIGFLMGKVVVMGGLTPGHSTTAVSVLVAERVHADLLIIATNVEGVFSRDPTKNKNAKLHDRISPRDLYKIVTEEGARAGEYKLLDPVSVAILERSKIKTIILNGDKPQNIINAVSGSKIGTQIN